MNLTWAEYEIEFVLVEFYLEGDPFFGEELTEPEKEKKCFSKYVKNIFPITDLTNYKNI